MKNTRLYLVFGTLFLVGVLATYIGGVSPQGFLDNLFSSKQYAYKENIEGILFASNDAPIDEIVTYLSAKSSYVLVINGLEGVGTLNSFMSQGLIQQQLVFTGHGKITTTIARIYDNPRGTWVGCQTNYGNIHESSFVSVSECEQLLGGQNMIRLETAFPDSSRSRPLVEFTPESITIYPVTENQIPGVSFLVLHSLYPDAATIIGAANQAIAGTNPSSANKSSSILDTIAP